MILIFYHVFLRTLIVQNNNPQSSIQVVKEKAAIMTIVVFSFKRVGILSQTCLSGHDPPVSKRPSLYRPNLAHPQEMPSSEYRESIHARAP